MPNFELGKYAVYIVPAYVIAFVVIAAAVADTLGRSRRWKRKVEQLEALKTAGKRKP
jgi:heme exporter protein CcmD